MSGVDAGIYYLVIWVCLPLIQLFALIATIVTLPAYPVVTLYFLITAIIYPKPRNTDY